MSRKIPTEVRAYMAKIGANGGRAGKGRPKVRDYKKMGQASGKARRAKSRQKRLANELQPV
jgi:hypothetical protein